MDKKNLTAEETFILAVQNQRKNNFQVAENLYRQTLNTNPDHVGAHNNLGVILLQLGKLQEAKSSCQKAIQINPNYASAHNNLGEIFRNLKEFQKAADCFKKVVTPLGKAQFLECVYLLNGQVNYNKLLNHKRMNLAMKNKDMNNAEKKKMKRFKCNSLNFKD